MSEWVTQREAASLLGVHVSVVPKMVRRGDLHPRSGRPSLSRREVLELREARAAAAVRRAQRRTPAPGPRPPDGEHVWLRAAGAAAVLGSTPVAVAARARRDRLPSRVHDGARWYALEHLELVKHAADARAGDR